jgi:hypothetical protein
MHLIVSKHYAQNGRKKNSNMASCFDALKSSKHYAQNKKRKEKI